MQNLDIKDEENGNENEKNRAAIVYMEDAPCMWEKIHGRSMFTSHRIS
jgi:hypothetical protein